MIRACALVLAGGFAAQHSRLAPSSDISLLLLVASLLMFSCARVRYPACFILGLAWFFLAGQQIVDGRLPQRYAGDSLLAEVLITDFPRKIGDATVMTLEPVDDPRLPPRSRVSWFEPRGEPAIGDVWQLELRLRRPRSLSNPGVFDREAWLFRNEIQATGYVVGGARNHRLQTGMESPVDAFRRRFVARSAGAASSPGVAAVLAAIGVGARHGISRQQWDRYAISGTSHLMAISGLHIGLAASAAFLLARLVTGFLPGVSNAHLASVLVAAASAIAYAVVSGLGVPAQRASVMLIIAAATVLRRRVTSPPEIVLLAALVVFMMQPVAIMAPGFQLSFSAVLLLLWLARVRNRGPKRRCCLARAGRSLRQLLRIQVFLLFGLMPLTVVAFQRIAPLALPVNVIAVPLFSIVTVPLTLIALVLGDFMPAVAGVSLRMAASSIAFLEAIIAPAVSLPFTDILVAEIPGHLWLVVMLPALSALLPRGWPIRSIVVPAVAALVLQSPARPPAGCLDAYVLDVGQGLATVLQTGSRTLVFDTGASFRGGGSMAEQVIVPFLRSKGLRRIDWLIVSHADIDHSGGVGALFAYAAIGELLAGEPLRETQESVVRCRAGRRWSADGIVFRILHPRSARLTDGNDSSCVLLVEAGRSGLLLTGDIEADAEREILENGSLRRVEAVVIPHHGSLTSSSPPFVKAVAPRLAIVSSGFENRWGFPKAAVAARWSAAGARVLNTATSGAVSFRICSDSGLGTVELDRHERRRFWRRGPD